MRNNKDFFSPTTGTSVVIANMIGTGVFTILGYQLLEIQSGFVLLMLWVVGGFIALCGALSYAELGATLPRSGGEYNFLGKIYHPAAGFISGWVSSTIGFSAPVALASITFGRYLSSVFPVLSDTLLAIGLIIVLSAVHATSRRNSGNLQQTFTLIKLLLIVLFCLLALTFVKNPTALSFLPAAGDGAIITSGAFAVALIYVNYAYTGWNAATYLSSELENPQQSLPRILGMGTAIVVVMYVMLNFTFLRVAPADAMAGQVELGYIAATYVFGEIGAKVMGIVLALLLISTVSAMVLSGPRVLHVIGEDYPIFKKLGKRNQHGVPATAIYIQSVLAIIFVVTASFEQILVFAGFTMGLNSMLAVVGLFVLRRKSPQLERPYKVFAYPIVPLFYVSLMAWTLVFTFIEKPRVSSMSVVIVLLGYICYLLVTRVQKNQQ